MRQLGKILLLIGDLILRNCFFRWYNGIVAAAAAKSLQSCPTLCDPIDSSPPGFPFPGILQARTLEWVAISFSNAWKWKVKVKSLSCVRLLVTEASTAVDCSLRGSSIYGISQARVLEWGAIALNPSKYWADEMVLWYAWGMERGAPLPYGELAGLGRLALCLYSHDSAVSQRLF